MKRRDTTIQEYEEILGPVLGSGNSAAGAGKFLVTASRAQLVAALRSFGEAAVADRIPSLRDADMRKLFERAGSNFTDQANYVRAICLAAIEIVEGKPRPLAGERRPNAT